MSDEHDPTEQNPEFPVNKLFPLTKLARLKETLCWQYKVVVVETSVCTSQATVVMYIKGLGRDAVLLFDEFILQKE